MRTALFQYVNSVLVARNDSAEAKLRSIATVCVLEMADDGFHDVAHGAHVAETCDCTEGSKLR
jgi:hypothetical protein